MKLWDMSVNGTPQKIFNHLKIKHRVTYDSNKETSFQEIVEVHFIVDLIYLW